MEAAGMYSIKRSGSGQTEVIELSDHAERSSVRIAPNYGFNCFSFKVQLNGLPADLLFAEPGFPDPSMKATRNGIPILAPFPNRIRAGKFTYEGKSFGLPCNEQGVNAIHGFAVDQPWRVIAENTSECAEVQAEFQLSRDRPSHLSFWPADFLLRVAYRLKGNRLTTVVEVENPSPAALPFGFGTHPYFKGSLNSPADAGRCRIQSPAANKVELAAALPTGVVSPVDSRTDLQKIQAVGDRTFDDVLTGLSAESDGVIRHRFADGARGSCITLEHGVDFPYTVIFIPPHRGALCIEPYTCVTDAINLGERLGPNGPPTGLWRLSPGEKRSFELDLVGSPA
jgi:aldose 1-epimerase